MLDMVSAAGRYTLGRALEVMFVRASCRVEVDALKRTHVDRPTADAECRRGSDTRREGVVKVKPPVRSSPVLEEFDGECRSVTE